ncbi:MAG: SDR family NAD(P)-dependent oxidoreductase [Pseudomonadota bacterium]
MTKTILITGATDGIGLGAAELLSANGHTILLHGRNAEKLVAAQKAVAAQGGSVETYLADLSDLSQVAALAEAVAEKHDHLDALINNAGVLRAPVEVTGAGLDLRFVVNTIAPYLLTQRLWSLLGKDSRVVNISSAAQAPVNLSAMTGQGALEAMSAYSQSKLAITMWSRDLAAKHPDGPSILAVNPGSLLATKMVKEGFGMAGSDAGVGARILVDAATSDKFSGATGQYWDNDIGAFGPPHRDALDLEKCAEVAAAIDRFLAQV